MFDLPRSTRLIARRIGIPLALTSWMSCIALPVYSRTGPQSSSLARGDLTLKDRINYQRAIEAVYWRYRIWPKENHQAKPALDDVMPLTAIRAKLEDYLGKSQALEAYWQRPITGEQLQAEMDRMARQTKQPAILKELWAALGNDPYVIAECLARPSLANRLIRNWYAHDERCHGELKTRAEADLRAYGTAGQMRQMSGEYHEIEWVKQEGPGDSAPGDSVILSAAKNPAMTLSPDKWETKVRELTQLFGVGAIRELSPSRPTVAAISDRRPASGAPPLQIANLDLLSVGELSRLQEDDNRFYLTAVLEKSSKRLKVATVEWRKQPFDVWWKGQHGGTRHASAIQQPSYAYRLAAITSGCGTCADDTWTPTLAALPSAREGHTAVWTGSEMIIWGGLVGGPVDTGGRYDPATDTWTATTTTNAPSARQNHTAVWTGNEMIIWGGGINNTGTRFNTGGRYDPVSDTWTATATTNAPSARYVHTAVWTCNEMIIWGGLDADTYVNTGGRYDPATDRWTPTSTNNAPSVRTGHTAVWTGNEMIVWGGSFGATPLNTGGRYDPVSDSWTETTNAPSARFLHTAVWTGSEMIVWGGTPGSGVELDTGGRYDPATDSWTPTATTNAPSARAGHTAVWTGSEMIVWGGGLFSPHANTGGRYDPATDSWTPTAMTNTPSARTGHTAVWTGSEMIVWGGGGADIFSSGGRYDPATDSWTPTSANNVPSARSGHTAFWTGSEMIVWGGPFLSNSGGRYDPATDSWTTTSTNDAPSGRSGHTAVWTGTEMIVWGGANNAGLTNTGGRYNPATDSWTPTSTNNAPGARHSHTGVWTGSEMIVWGGGPPATNTGGRYNPATDSWTPTSNGPNALYHTAVWTGKEMIVWGGAPIINTGGRYDPATDTWAVTSTNNAPSPRAFHTAVWTGSEMIVWGGRPMVGELNTGGRYDPATDSWTATATTNAPSARDGHTAIWTGSEMIVWGGYEGRPYTNTGGRYDPATDSWTPTSTNNAPSARASHTAVWTGSEMIIWGGGTDQSLFDTGGRYCASAGNSAAPRLFQ